MLSVNSEQDDNKEGNVLNQWNKMNKVMKNIRPTDFVDAYWQERYGMILYLIYLIYFIVLSMSDTNIIVNIYR
jgi:hypothetical protein